MEMKFKFDNEETLTIEVFDTQLNKKLLELWSLAREENIGFFEQTMAREIGRDKPRTGNLNAALEKICKGFELTGITPPVSLDGPLTIYDCNIIHRTFTNGFRDKLADVPDLQLINHGAHEYESILESPNYISLDHDIPSDQILGYDLYQNIAKYTIDILDSDKEDLSDSADIYLYDECRIGRSFSDAWCQNDDPSEWDIRDIDRAGPLLIFQNALRKKLYNSTRFHKWLEKYNAQDKVYKDIPFANIKKGSYIKIVGAKLLEIEW